MGPTLENSGEVVGERFAYFLDASDLTRDTFVEAVDGAIGARSLYAVLSGQRRPSRSLAVLIERIWGFRADFLLDGSGPMWASIPAGVAESDGLSPAEREVVTFMRESVENAKSIRIELDKARLWRRVFDRTLTSLMTLEGRRDHADDMASIALVLDDSQRSARAFERYIVALHRRRAMRLTELFVNHYAAESRLPVSSIGAATLHDTRRLVGTSVEQLDDEIHTMRKRLEAIATTPSTNDLRHLNPDVGAIALSGIVASTLST